jgi:hypothetical protein
MSTARVITKRDVIRGVRARWNEQYARYRDDETLNPVGGRVAVGTVRARLAALDLETCTGADIDAAIGAPRWAENRCDECDKDVDRLVRIGDEPDYDARWRDVCPDCIDAMRRALEQRG